MRRDIGNSRLLHYTLLVLSLAGATVGGLVFLGCWGPKQVQDVTVVDPTQANPEGGVQFGKSDPRQTARVNLTPDVDGHPVTWKCGDSPTDQSYSRIPDPAKSHEVEVSRSLEPYSVVFLGEYTDANGRTEKIGTVVQVTPEGWEPVVEVE